MKREGPRGAVSIFLSCVLLAFITFTCSIADITRIHAAQVYVNRALQYASQSLLAMYDSQLQSQYGIFGRYMPSQAYIKNSLTSYLEANLSGTDFQLYQVNIKANKINSTIPLLDSDIMKQQILEFMKYRAPYQALEPFLEKLGLITNASKASSIIKQKNEIMSKITELEGQYYDLIMYVEGLTFHYELNNLLLNDDGTPLLSNNYIKKMVTQYSTGEIYSSDEIPDPICQAALNSNVWYLKTTLKNYKEELMNLDYVFGKLVGLYTQIKSANEEINSNYNTINTLYADIRALQELEQTDDVKAMIKSIEETIKSISKINDSLRSTIESYHKEISKWALDYSLSESNIYTVQLPKLKMIISEETEDVDTYGTKALHQLALAQIDTIKTTAETVKVAIAEYKNKLASETDETIRSLSENILAEIESYEIRLGLTDDPHLQNDLDFIKEGLNKNMQLFDDVYEQVTLLESLREPLFYYWVNKYTSDEEIKFSVFQRLSLPYTSQQVVGNPYDRALSSLSSIETILEPYERNLKFDYGSLPIKLVDGITVDKLLDLARKIFPGVPLLDLTKKIKDKNLPSLNIDSSSSLGLVGEISFEGNDKNLDNLISLSEGLKLELLDLRDALYINEYAIGMFSTFTDYLEGETSKDKPVTLTHYPKKDHYLKCEVEYILFGHDRDDKNLEICVGSIFAIRIAFNTISLLFDYSKMARITELANAIAGWWSLGIGSIVVGGILTLIWAVVESVSDVQKLLNNDTVPIVKTPETWETDFIGGIKEAAESVAEEALDKVTEENAQISIEDIDVIPKLSYNDYLRLFLLCGVVSEETKLYRIFDLIQMNISNERKEEIILDEYITGFEAEATFEVNYIFFNLPFMPKQVKSFGSSYQFTEIARVGY